MSGTLKSWDYHETVLHGDLNNNFQTLWNMSYNYSNNVLNVRNVGAVGNGIADDTNAFSIAFSYLSSLGGHLVSPYGTYLINSYLSIPSNVIWDLDGSTIVLGSGLNTNYARGNSAFINSNQPTGTILLTLGSIVNSNISIKNGIFDASLQSSGAQKTFLFMNVNNVRLENLTFINGGDGSAFIDSSNYTIDKCNGYGQTNASFDNWYNIKNARITNCYSTPATLSGITQASVFFNGLPGFVNTLDGVIISSCDFYGAIGLDPMDSGQSHNLKIIGSRISGVGVIGRGAMTGLNIIGNHFINSASSSVSLVDIDSAISQGATVYPSLISVIGNTFYYNPAVQSGSSCILINSPNTSFNVVSDNIITGAYGTAINLLNGSCYGAGNVYQNGSSVTVYGTVFNPAAAPNGTSVWTTKDSNAANTYLRAEGNYLNLYGTTASGAATLVQQMTLNTNTPGITFNSTAVFTNTTYFLGTEYHRGTLVGFYNASPTPQPVVSGSRGGNTALASLLTAMSSLGLITNSTTT